MTPDRPLRVTWLGHGAERTGPPIYLLRLLEGLQHHPEVEPSVVLLQDGPLLDSFRDLAPTRVIEAGRVAPTRRAVASTLSRLGATRRAGEVISPTRSAPGPGPDIVVVNTAGSIAAEVGLAQQPRKLISHVHELATGLDYWLAPSHRRRVLEQSDEIWVVADAVGCHLVSEYGVDAGRLRTHRGVLPAGALDAPDEATVTGHRQGLGLEPTDVLIGASGTLDWRKAPDLFVEVAARAIRACDRPMHVAWIGGDTGGPWGRCLRSQARAAGIADRVHMIAEADRPDRWFGALDLFLLPSREDAYPLVCLEAAAAGVPIVAFESGGVVELLAEGAGVSVPYPDVAAMVRAVSDLIGDQELHAQAATHARAAAARHTVEHALPPMINDLRRVAST